ncbi:ABC-type dipeptide/oligopeptide/nickel transport systems, permease components [Microbacterium sp. C448]|jgi:hypothetical protein|uniref:hypothetical protein n=1 Tax=Microbacterium TaxID=33882 RepID=UPI0003DE0E80|nr:MULTISPECIES: hypothetical protein [Microbacterium]MDO8383824.1 hypothetical protein [Microbacterium sp.]CDK00693.1 ABC-type dipeptide/oligopeptide/nickel transport systems, permease components [Microbacterium sp. C448]|tara:strand:+ start:2596 stop:2931 length:336 start_codon:yes stop_codon:yes gene_type:complete
MALVEPPIAPSRMRTVWVSVGPGLIAGNRGGNFLGCIDEVLGGFVATDARGEPVGRYLELSDAKAALGRRSSDALLRRKPRMARLGLTAATGMGVVALGVALAAVALTTFR